VDNIGNLHKNADSASTLFKLPQRARERWYFLLAPVSSTIREYTRSTILLLGGAERHGTLSTFTYLHTIDHQKATKWPVEHPPGWIASTPLGGTTPVPNTPKTHRTHDPHGAPGEAVQRPHARALSSPKIKCTQKCQNGLYNSPPLSGLSAPGWGHLCVSEERLTHPVSWAP